MIKRALLKISGEAFGPEGGGGGLDVHVLRAIAREIKTAFDLGTQLVLVVGGGNFIRGAQIQGDAIHRASADYMGMLATVINAIAVQEVLESEGVPVRIQSSLRIDAVAEPFVRRRALNHLEKGYLVILAGGTGKPFVTTDTAAAQAALELGCEVVFKATNVDGVYDRDPRKFPDATKYDQLSYNEILNSHEAIRVMDVTAISLCMDNHLPIQIFDLRKPGNIERAIRGGKIGTRVSNAHSSETPSENLKL